MAFFTFQVCSLSSSGYFDGHQNSKYSGPKRYDYVPKDDGWYYGRDGRSINDLLEHELENALGRKVELGLNEVSRKAASSWAHIYLLSYLYVYISNFTSKYCTPIYPFNWRQMIVLRRAWHSDTSEWLSCDTYTMKMPGWSAIQWGSCHQIHEISERDKKEKLKHAIIFLPNILD